jgi:hypothetical protein
VIHISAKNNQLNDVLILLLGLALMFGGYMGIGYWFANSDCVTTMSMSVADQTQDIPLNMSDNLKRFMCVSQNQDVFVVSILSPFMLVVGLYTVVKGMTRLLGSN